MQNLTNLNVMKVLHKSTTHNPVAATHVHALSIFFTSFQPAAPIYLGSSAPALTETFSPNPAEILLWNPVKICA